MNLPMMISASSPRVAALALDAIPNWLANLLSGLVGALLGGLLVALNDSRLQRRQNLRADRAAGRLVCLELVSNYYHVENLAEFALQGKQDACIRLYSDRAWTAEQVRIASLLGAGDLDKVIGPNNNQTIGATIDSGRLTAGGLTPAASSDLYVFNRANTLTINSRIVDNTNGGGYSEIRGRCASRHSLGSRRPQSPVLAVVLRKAGLGQALRGLRQGLESGLQADARKQLRRSRDLALAVVLAVERGGRTGVRAFVNPSLYLRSPEPTARFELATCHLRVRSAPNCLRRQDRHCLPACTTPSPRVSSAWLQWWLHDAPMVSNDETRLSFTSGKALAV